MDAEASTLIPCRAPAELLAILAGTSRRAIRAAKPAELRRVIAPCRRVALVRRGRVGRRGARRVAGALEGGAK